MTIFVSSVQTNKIHCVLKNGVQLKNRKEYLCTLLLRVLRALQRPLSERNTLKRERIQNMKANEFFDFIQRNYATIR